LSLLEKNKNPVLDIALKTTKIYGTLEEMMADVDVVDICTPPKYHMDNIKFAVEHGKHVICEKPLAINWWTLKAYQDVLKKMKDQKLKFMLHTQGIWHPLIKEGRDLIASGTIGDIIKIRILHQGADIKKHTVNLAPLWDKFHGGGGALVDIGPHAFAGMWYWLGGNCETEAVEAKLLKAVVPVRTIAGVPNTKVMVDDDAHVTITWKDPAGRIITGDMEASWNKKDWFEGKPAGTDIFYEARGTKGTISFPHIVFSMAKPFGIAVAIKIVDNEGKVKLVKFPIPKKRIEDVVFFDEVADVVAGKVESRNDARFAEDMLQVFGAAYLSRKKGGKVTTLREFKDYATGIANKFPTAGEQIKGIIADLFDGF